MPTPFLHDEKTMLSMVAAGNRVSFAQLYNLYLGQLYNYILLFTKSNDETEEILQEIFIRIWIHRDRLPQVDSIKEYLFKMAKNKLLDNIRHEKVRHRVLAELKRSRDIAAPITNDQCAFREYYREVQQAIEQLPPKRKLIFRLNIENGLSQDEIAGQLHISKSVVQKQLYSASRFVRQYLVEHSEISIPLLLLASLPVFQ